MSLDTGTKLGVYEILGSIGAGGMGEVYMAADTRLHREVAIKVSAERFSERFEREARAIASLNHPNICTLHDVGPNYLVMELVEGETLAERIEQGPLPLGEALAIAKQIQAALAAAHEKDVVHRDLKPGNIKVKAGGAVKVLDFGLAKMGGPPADPVRFQTSTPTLAGGVDFYMAMSPDGRKLAYTAIASDGVNHIWVRAMDTLESRELSGTEGGVSLFWSPDSRFIGFGQGARLKKVDASGASPPVTLCEITGTVGMGSWSKDDVIVFGGRGSGPLRLVPASGGAPVEITAVGASESNHSFPFFLPDGRRFLYLRISSNADIRGIYDGIIGVTPREQPSQRILGAQFGAIYVPSPGSDTGRLLFLRESTLMTQPFDTGRLELTGEPVPIAEQVGAAGSGGKWMVSNGGGGQPRWRADGKEMRTAAGHAGQPMGYDSRRSKTPVQQQRNRNCHGADNGRSELAGDS